MRCLQISGYVLAAMLFATFVGLHFEKSEKAIVTCAQGLVLAAFLKYQYGDLKTGMAAFKDLQAQTIDNFENFCDSGSGLNCYGNNGHQWVYSIADVENKGCFCSLKPSDHLVQQRCSNMLCSSDYPVAYYWPGTNECFCDVDDYFNKSWNNLDNSDALKRLFNNLMHVKAASPNLKAPLNKRQRQSTPTATSASTAASNTVLSTFIPPPKVDITPQLINESLALQPQDTATVSSVVPLFKDSIITFGIQLNGIVATSLSINASTAFPCGAIGTEPEPNIELVPKYVQQGTTQTVIADCLCIAVNMYTPNAITYWIQNADGNIFSLVSGNKVMHINEINTSAPIAINLIAAPANSTDLGKRRTVTNENNFPLPRYQVVNMPCDRTCSSQLLPVEGSDHQCGCMSRGASQGLDLTARGLHEPDAYTAVMTKEACSAMKCNINHGKPAMFNPFSKTCWCVDASYIETNDDAWTGA